MFCKTCGNNLKEGSKFCTKCGAESLYTKDQKKKIFLTKKRILIFGIISFVVLVSIFIIFSPTTNQDVASSVVNIYCTNSSSGDAFGGSGTILTEDGIVLTNAHIIPEGIDGVASTICMVTLPDPSTGSPKEIYYAYPVIIPEISEKYDLAFVQIDDVYVDEEGNTYGEYPKIFPAYDSKYCGNENLKLGEPVKIYGYPAISGGYALTVTDGVVSSLLIDEGLIVTSAKISNGNSGGLAVDQYGCMIGVPSMVSVDENESLGVIISSDLISEFAGEVMNFTDSTN